MHLLLGQQAAFPLWPCWSCDFEKSEKILTDFQELEKKDNTLLVVEEAMKMWLQVWFENEMYIKGRGGCAIRTIMAELLLRYISLWTLNIVENIGVQMQISAQETT